MSFQGKCRAPCIEKDVKASYYRKRNRDLSSAFNVEGPLCYSNDIEELFPTLDIVHIVNKWRLFIDSSMRSLKSNSSTCWK